MAGRALGFASPLAESPGESLSRVRMLQARLPLPTLQHVVCDSAGCFVARLDFWWEEFGLAGEFDGMVEYGRLLRPGQSVEGGPALLLDARPLGRALGSRAGPRRGRWPRSAQVVGEVRRVADLHGLQHVRTDARTGSSHASPAWRASGSS